MGKLVKCEILKVNGVPVISGYSDNTCIIGTEKAKRLVKQKKVRIIEETTNVQKPMYITPIKKPPLNYERYKNSFQLISMVPYLDKKRLGQAYNRAMVKIVDDWVLFFDQDVLLGTNPFWYNIVMRAIGVLGHKAGLITCYTNRIGNKIQKAPGVSTGNHDIKNYHIPFAANLYNKNKGNIKEIKQGGFISGFLMITHKQAWRNAGGFLEKRIGSDIFHIDNDYHRKIKKVGYRIYLLEDLYVYHGYMKQAKLFRKD